MNENNNEIFNLMHPFEKSIDRSIPYHEFVVPAEAKDIYRRWISVTVEKSDFIRFLDRIGIFHKADGSGSPADSQSRASADLVIKQYEESGRVVERHFSEVTARHEETAFVAKGDAGASAYLSNGGPPTGARSRKSVQRVQNAIAEQLTKVYPDGVPPALPVKSIKRDLEDIAGLTASETSVRRALEGMGLRTPTLEPTLRSRRSSQASMTPDKSDKPKTP